MTEKDLIQKIEIILEKGVDTATDIMKKNVPMVNQQFDKTVKVVKTNLPIEISDKTIKGFLITGSTYVGYNILTTTITSVTKATAISALTLGGIMLYTKK